MIVTTFISEEGAVSVTVDTDEAEDELPAFAVLALEQVARQSTTSALATWLQLRNTDDDHANADDDTAAA